MVKEGISAWVRNSQIDGHTDQGNYRTQREGQE